MHTKTPLARWLKQTGRSVRQTAAQLGISRQRLYHYLHGHHTPSDPKLLRALVALTGLSADALLRRGKR